MSKWQWLIRQFSKKLWVRTTLFCLLAAVTALAAVYFKHYIPEDISRKMGADSVDKILQILANSMLAVTIFSLSAMVAAYGAATTNVTPRATKIMLADNTAQNALSVFMGTFLFSLVGLVALSMGAYGNSGRLILFGVTVLIILLMVAVLIRWINYLRELGRVSQTIDMVERATADAIEHRLINPFLGGIELKNFTPKKQHAGITADRVGYIQNIDMAKLQRIAEECDIEIFVVALPGAFNDSSIKLVYLSKAIEDRHCAKIAAAFSIGDERSFEQDPRFGLIVLSEIASRALSPAVNDPGTAIDVIGTGVRVLLPWVKTHGNQTTAQYDRIHVPPLRIHDLLDDWVIPIARDGATMVEVGVRLQKALGSLAAVADEETLERLREHGKQAIERAEHAGILPQDLSRIRQVSIKK